MPLPANGAVWPPKEFKEYFDLLGVYDACYVGDTTRMRSSYRGPVTHPAQYNGGILGAGARAVLGQPPAAHEQRLHLHIPLPADIATLSADYLFSEAPRVVFPGERSENGDSPRDRIQERAEKVINSPRTHSLLLEAAEVASALGGTYLRLVWDQPTLGSVMAETVHADAAIPTFRFGQLREVTFWNEYADEKSKVWRHLERHAPGVIEHALYEGDAQTLGVRVEITERSETAWLAKVLNEDSEIVTGVETLTAAYVPNMRPNKHFRRKPALSLLGKSDYSDIVQLFEALNETWSSWMRDIRIAKARIVVSQQYLQSGGFGQGARFDYDREVYEGMNSLTDPSGNGFGFHAHQFQIRVEEHARTVQELRDQAMRSAGWTPGSAGGNAQGLRTATEIKADERLSERTRDKKANYWKTLSPFFLTWMQIDAALYGGDSPKEEPEFRFPAEAQADQESMARTNQMLYAAQSASIETRVRMQHPEWDGETVNTEVGRIKEEFGIGQAADPTTVGTVDDATAPTSADIEAMRERMERELRAAAAD